MSIVFKTLKIFEIKIKQSEILKKLFAKIKEGVPLLSSTTELFFFFFI